MEGVHAAPPQVVDELDAIISSVFAQAVDARSSLERVAMIEARIRDTCNSAFARAIRPSNARFSYQDRLPPEIWFNVWNRLSVTDRFRVTHVSARWRDLAINCAELWTWIDCYARSSFAPDGSLTTRSTLGLVPQALSRSQGMGLCLEIYYHSQYPCLHADRLCTMLAPYSNQIVEVSLCMSFFGQAETFIDSFPPLLSLRALSTHICEDTLLPMNHIPPLLPATMLLPKLERLILPAGFQYAWPEGDQSGYIDGARCEETTQPPLHAVRTLQFAPSTSSNLILALRSCPHVSSLTLNMGLFDCRKEHAETVCSLALDITHVHLLDVQARHIDCVLRMFAASGRQCFFVSIAPFLRRAPLPLTVAPRAPDTDTFYGQKLLLRFISQTRDMLKSHLMGQTAGPVSPRTEDDAPEAPQAASVSAPVFRVINEVPLSSHIDTIPTLCALFDDLDAEMVDAIFRTSADHRYTTLSVTTASGRSRVAGLACRDNDVAHKLLTQIWSQHLPLDRVGHLAVEFALFPILLHSLPDVVPVRMLELLFTPQAGSSYDGPTFDGRAVRLELQARPRFPELRTLRLGPGDPDAAVQTLLSANNIAQFIGGLGAELPLDTLEVCRGVKLDDPVTLQHLAQSLDLQADPTFTIHHL